MTDDRKPPLRVNRDACSTCPYLKATPPGVWHRVEYEKLRYFDVGEEAEWPDGSRHRVPALGTFHCHQENASGIPTACKGWVVVHRDSVAMKVAMIYGAIDPDDVPFEHDDRYYATGTEACEAGLTGVVDPSDVAKKVIDKLIRRGVGSESEDDE